MTDLRKAAEMALEALEGDSLPFQLGARAALRQALAQPEQEPVVWLVQYKDHHEFVWGSMPVFRGNTVLGIEPLYTAPPKREWVGLTDDDFNVKKVGEFDVVKFAKYIETLLKERNFGSAD